MSAADPAVEPQRRTVRSFVLRQGRLTPAQARALQEHWPRYGLQLTPGEDGGTGAPPYTGTGRDSDDVGRHPSAAVSPTAPFDVDAVFGRTAERVLEIGFGNGEALLASAIAEPQRDFIGVEVHGPGVGRLLRHAAEAGLANLRVFQHDAVEVLQHAIAEAALAEVRVFFPDPWPKKRHHKRRLIQPDTVQLIRRKLRPGGVLHLATDWPDYAGQMLEVMEAAPGFRNRAGAGRYAPRPDSRPLTHFEQRGVRLGHPVFDLIYETIPT